ncbi:MAG: DUF6531 domain-containing protein, partial [Vicinamibacteria bacterium]
MISVLFRRRLNLGRAAALCCVTSVMAATQVRADDRELLLRLDRAISQSRGARADREVFVALLADLERADAEKRRTFDRAASRPLPEKARKRLNEATQAYATGQGRILSLVRALAGKTGGPSGSSLSSTAADFLVVPAVTESELKTVLGRIEVSTRREPRSASLNVRVPALKSIDPIPPEPQVTPASFVITPIGSIPPLLKDAAATLDGPVDVYDYVRINIRPELYAGAMKGPVQTYLEGSGNDVDTASLLAMLLRAKGFEARYARGMVEIPAAALRAYTGASTPELAVRALTRAGISHEVVTGAGGIASVKCERTWVESYIPYVNYRGAQIDQRGKAWIPLDGNFKSLATPSGVDPVAELGFDARATLDQYLSGVDRRLPTFLIQERVQQLIQERQPDLSYASVSNRRGHLGRSLGLLPSTLPYRTVALPAVSDQISPSLSHTVRVVGEGADGRSLFSISVDTANVLGRRFTLSYIPFSPEDVQIARMFGGIEQTPPFLIDVQPVIKIGGVSVAAGSVGIGMGVKFTLRLEFDAPAAHEVISNTVIAGNLMAIGLGGRQTTAGESNESQGAQILAARAWSYLMRWSEADEQLADLLHVLPIRPTVSACLVSSDIQSDYAGGDPLYPLNFDWKGIVIDADLRSTAPSAVRSIDRERDFLLLSGLVGSVLENKIFEDDLHIESVSTAKGLQLAREQGIEIVDLDGGNAATLLPGLNLDPGVTAEIEAAIAKGLSVRVPAREMTHLAWTGAPYLVINEETGETGWQIQGGHAGGVTAPAVINIPASIVDPLIRQREEQEPVESLVAHIERFLSTDFQFGTVGKALSIPLRVLATDADGFAVKHAQVTFQALAGGGHFIDPITGQPAEGQVTVFSNENGEAEAVFVLGESTRIIPRFIKDEGDVQPTQVGLNLVTAFSGPAILPEPFNLIGKPDDRADGSLRYAYVYWQRAYNTSDDSRLALGGYFSVNASDQFANPLSNFEILVRYRPAPVQLTPPAGWSVRFPANTSPATLLNFADYTQCIKTIPTPLPGECAGEAQEVVDISGPFGAGVVIFLGESPYSLYTFDAGTVSSPGLLTLRLSTGAWLCSGTHCSLNAPPDGMIVQQGRRPSPTNESGSAIEAYPPGAVAQMTFGATVLFQEARAEPEVDAHGVMHYRARALPKWTRRRLTNSEFALEPRTPGTTVSPSTVAYDGSDYRAAIITAPSPQNNVVRFTGRHRPPGPRYLSSVLLSDGFPALDPQYVNAETGEITLVPIDSPVEIRSELSLWGATASLRDLTPAPVMTSPTGAVVQESTIVSDIQPAAYAALLSTRNVEFELSRVLAVPPTGAPVTAPVLKAYGTGAYRIPAGLGLPTADYVAKVSVLDVALTSPVKHITSLPFDVSACQLVSLRSREVKLSLVRDTLNDSYCGSEAQVEFTVCRDSLVTLKIDGQVVTGGIDKTDTTRAVSDLRLNAGIHHVSLSPGLLGFNLGASAPLLVSAVAISNPTLRGEDEGVVLNSVANRSSLPVGHTFVKGVDLFDGHLVQQASDLRARGRHLGLDVTRTYSSGGSDSEGLLGAGWHFNYESRVFVTSCGVVVQAFDGGSQAFTPLLGGGFKAQKGYHSTLVQNSDSSYDFTDKAGIVQHFRESEDPSKPSGSRRLDWIRDPHGDELRFVYDVFGRLSSVAEWHPETAAALRTLNVTYVPALKTRLGFSRIARLEIQPHGITADYTYDSWENLESVTTSTGLTWRYGYSVSSPLDRHQLLSVVDPNGARTEYVYFGKADPFPGETLTQQGGLAVVSKEEFVKLIREFPDAAVPLITAETQFAFDYTGALAGTYKTAVSDPLNHETHYTADSNGAVTLIEEPENRKTIVTWKPADILKATETDPNGRLTEYDYDARGNRTLERIHTADLGVIETASEYEQRFNRMTLSRDAEGRETRYEVDPDTGDVKSVTDALLNKVINSYDEHGQLVSTRDPRGFVTQYRDFTTYGDPQEMEDPLSNRVQRVYDARGRMTDETDTMGRSKTLTYDEQDRVLSQLRRAGGPAGNLDEVSSKTYYPLGQTQSETNANGGVTSYALDGMNRLIQTTTPSGDVVTTWNADSTKRTEKDRRGVGKRFIYDGVHRLTKVDIDTPVASSEGPIGQIAQFEYDLAGNKTLERDHAGRVTRYEYDGLYRVRRKDLPQLALFERTVYDKVGNRLSAFDANGHETRMTYDALNRPTSARRDPEGLNLTVITEYNEGVASATHVNKSAEEDVTRGLRTEFKYDALNRETERRVIQQGEDGDPSTENVTYVTTTAYDDSQHSVSVTDARGSVVSVRMDGLDRPTTRSQLDVCGAGQPACSPGTSATLVSETVYDGLSNKTREIDPAGRVKSWAYDEQGRLESATDFAGTTSYGYDGEGLKTSEKNRRNIERAFTYDNLARPRTERLVSAPLSGVSWSRETRYLDTANNWRRVEKDARGFETTLHLDGLGRETKMVDPDGFLTETTWDGVSKRTEKDRRGHTTSMLYDAADRLVRTTDSAPFSAQTVQIAYEDANNRKTETDRRGLITVTQSDPMGRTVTVTRSGVRLERNVYDANSNKVMGEDAEGKKTEFVYDRANRLVARVDGASSAESATTRFVMDGSGNKTAEIDPRSTDAEPSMRYIYDGASRQTDAFNGEGDQTHTEYDGEGNRVSVTPPAHPPTTYEWDELGKLTKVTQPPTADHLAPETTFGYDANRNKIRQTNARGHATTYTYDKLNRLKTMTEPATALAGPLVTSFTYDPNGNATVVVDPKGQTETTTFDELNRKTTTLYATAPSTPSTAWREVRKTEYDYDENNNPKEAREFISSGTDPPIPRTIARTFDTLDREESETTTLPDGGTKTVGYEYFQNGTRRTLIDAAGLRTAYTYDGKNRVATATTES